MSIRLSLVLIPHLTSRAFLSRMMKQCAVAFLLLTVASAESLRGQSEHKFDFADIASGFGDLVKSFTSPTAQKDESNANGVNSFVKGLKMLAVEAGKKAGKATVLAAMRPMALAMFEKQLEEEKNMPPEKRTLPKDITVEMFNEALNEVFDTNSEAQVRSRGEQAPEAAVDKMVLNKKVNEKVDGLINDMTWQDVAQLPTAIDIASKHLQGKDIKEVDLTAAKDVYGANIRDVNFHDGMPTNVQVMPTKKILQ